MNFLFRPQTGRIFLSLLILLLFMAACSGEEATPTPQPSATAVAEADPTEAATEAATETPIPEPTEAPTAVPTAEPTAEPTEAPEMLTAVFEEAACEFDIPGGRDVTCGWLTVPEDRNNPADETTIRLHVAIFASDSANPAPDPIVYLEGGPGGDALETIPLIFEQRFAPFTANREFIMFDQRGTGYSQPSLACPEYTQLGLDLLEEDISAEEALALGQETLLACRDRLLDEGVNLAAYNSAANAADLNDLRLALGYDEWNLLGLSYGTRLAQTTMRDHPQGLRSVILDSAYPLEANLLTDTPDNVARAFAVFFAGCAVDPVCQEAFPELETRFFALVDTLNAEKIPLTVTHLLNGTRYDTAVSGDDLLGILFQSLYITEIIPELPQLIVDIEEGDVTVLSALLSSFLINGEFFSAGMQFSVQCNEENIFAEAADVTAAAEKYPELAAFFNNSINLGPPALAVCAEWGAGTADALENEPISSDIPTLVLAGEYDPITPPAWGELVAASLENATFYEFPGTGHGVSVSNECGRELVESFLADPQSEPDASCLATVAAPLFTVPGGSGEAITLVPFENSTFGIAGVVPEGWQELSPGVYGRGSSALDQTIILQQAGPGLNIEQLLDLLSAQLGWDEVPQSSGSYEATARSWTLYETEVQGFPANLAFAEEDGATYFILLLSEAEDEEQLLNELFFPALEAFNVQ